MADLPKTIKQWQMTQPTVYNRETKETTPGKLEMVEIPVPELKEGEVLIEIAGCGVCHTDLGYFYDGVPTVSKPPLALGHEISGTVIAGDPAWVGKEVIIPAVLPCRKCILCKTGRGNRCLAQKMPGNSMGVFGGFASHGYWWQGRRYSARVRWSQPTRRESGEFQSADARRNGT